MLRAGLQGSYQCRIDVLSLRDFSVTCTEQGWETPVRRCILGGRSRLVPYEEADRAARLLHTRPHREPTTCLCLWQDADQAGQFISFNLDPATIHEPEGGIGNKCASTPIKLLVETRA